ncbi:hypothetical protein MC7420_5939 [Coleofasciculus chthonoplastes PCC 7420]|uniref:Uncharacterized protein n=1 Tax=Coleofasciculus chthonoplastes PCC 7420 TaxID=118168 RepID=B4VW42_9CYAN|nr:hypothetical protein [Coleofasciculus chthonoplastes]EDX74059.1 hypothetical protein MC7420_5939 [Coleofasciculus chthonoplastes PCC 7420]
MKDYPDLRDSIIRYYKDLGYTPMRFNSLISFLRSGHCIGDVSVFAFSKLLVEWEIDWQYESVNEIVELATQLAGYSSVHFVASIWMLAKYGSEEELFSSVERHSLIWKQSGFLARQVAALMPLFKWNTDNYSRIDRIIFEVGHADAIRILKNLEIIMSYQRIPQDMNLYLSTRNGGVYPLHKFLMSINILNNSRLCVLIRKEFRDKLVSQVITDPVYIRKLSIINLQPTGIDSNLNQ